MSNLLEHIEGSIMGIWGNKKYELVLGLDRTFFFEEKNSNEVIDGIYLILLIPNNDYPTLRLTETNGTQHDYNIIDVLIDDTLIISNEKGEIHLKSVSLDEYKGEIFNPSDN